MNASEHSSIDLTDPTRTTSPNISVIVSDLSDSEASHLHDEQVEERGNVAPAPCPLTTPAPTKGYPWLPYTLHWISLCLVLGFSILLGLAVIVVHVVSSRNSGLVEDTGSRAIVIGSKFVPTLLAVAFSMITGILLDDVKRTEPFARMASPFGATAKESVTWTAGAWWTIPSPLGKGKMPLFLATLIFFLASLVISPLSSTLLVTETVAFDEKTIFHKLDLISLIPLQPAPLATTYFRTISNILQNVSTTAWISNDYVILPFWPGNPEAIPLSPILTEKTRTWSADTTVFSIDLECQPMAFKWNSPALTNLTDSVDLSITLASKSGCTVNLDLGKSSSFFTYGGNVWSGVDSIVSRLNNLVLPNVRIRAELQGCSENEILISWSSGRVAGNDYFPTTSSSGEPLNDLANFSMIGQACQHTYYVGSSNVYMTVEQGESTFAVNQTQYDLSKVPLSAAIANTTAIDNIFFDLNWTVHIDEANALPITRLASSTGPANLLFAFYRSSQEQLFADTHIVESMLRIRRQFFAELLHSAYELKTTENSVSIPGSIITSSRRVVVVSAVAIVLEVALFIQVILIALVFYNTRLLRRPLGLTEDPSSIIGIVKLISDNHSTVKVFAECSNSSVDKLDQSLTTVRFTVKEGRMVAFNTPTSHSISSQEKDENLSPSHLQTRDLTNKKNSLDLLPLWFLALLFILLSLTLAAIASLYQLSQTRGLYETFFVYNIGISVNGSGLGSVNPASLLTTLIAVVIGLWWGAFEITLRRIQPYLALANSPVSGYKGVAVSYKSSYLLWAAYRAGKRRQWVLLLVSVGEFLAQIFTISMSSLWIRVPGELTTLMPMPKALELRTVPMLYEISLVGQGVTQDYIRTLFSNPSTSWLYEATTQLTLQGPDPPWSIDGWNFVPSALNNIVSKSIQNTGNSTESAPLSVNVTFETPAIRARLECSPYKFLDNQTRWITRWDLTDETKWNIAMNPKEFTIGYELGFVDDKFKWPNSFYVGEDPKGSDLTTFFANHRRLQCCENKTTSSTGLASIGYWSPNLRPDFYYPNISDFWPANFTIKWIRGRPMEGILRAGDSYEDVLTSLLWLDPPQMTALNCQPVIENAKSRVTIDSGDGRVLSYEILEEPRPFQDAWTSPWVGYQSNFPFEDLPPPDPSSPDPYLEYRNLEYLNVTVSHGVLFATALLGAADIHNIAGELNVTWYDIENVENNDFNIRQPGLNVDYMSYAMLSLAQFDHEQMLDSAVLEQTAQRTFSTMYQYFVNNNLSLDTGGYAYQALDEKLPDDIGALYLEPVKRDTGDSEDKITLQISRPVELLKVSKPAAWISMVILGYLIIACSVLIIVAKKYNHRLSGPFDSIADTAVLVAGSAKLLELSKSKSTREIKQDTNTRAKLGWFIDANGQRRHGVEVVDEVEKETWKMPSKLVYG